MHEPPAPGADAAVAQYSSRRLWELLGEQAHADSDARLANAIREELYRRGDFRPRGFSPPPY